MNGSDMAHISLHLYDAWGMRAITTTHAERQRELRSVDNSLLESDEQTSQTLGAVALTIDYTHTHKHARTHTNR